MREIKFRAKTTVKDEDVAFNNVWIEGDLIFSRRKPYIHPKANAVNVKGELGKIIVMHEVQADTVCQYTGLKDKNGKEIYEGDILHGKFYGYPFPCIETFTVKWHKADAGFLANYFNNAECEVIGNIFDNPELLERGAE